MKKIITVLAALAVTTAAAFAGPAISVGAGVGGSVESTGGNGTWEASPIISIKGDFQWEKLGIAADFDFNFKVNQGDDKDTVEILYVNPYVNFNAGDFNFNLGPIVGTRFEQVKNSSGSISQTYLIFGAGLNCNYKITDNLKAYLEIPVISNNMPISGDWFDFGYWRGKVEFAPKMGVMFTF